MEKKLIRMYIKILIILIALGLLLPWLFYIVLNMFNHKLIPDDSIFIFKWIIK